MAAPSTSPASPKTQLILLAVGLVSLAVQVGLVVFGELMSGRAIVADEVEPPAVAEERAQDQLDEMPFHETELEPDQLWTEPEEEASAEPAEVTTEVVAVSEDADDAVDAAPVTPEPVEDERIEPVLDAPAPPAIFAGTLDMADLTADLVQGHTHLVVLAGSGRGADCESLAADLVEDALAQGLSVALVDAGSGVQGDEPGLTDLSHDAVSFGDVVHKSADNSFAEVPWGQMRSLNRRSTRPLTLVEALGDIYEVVVLMTGQIEAGSTLPMFDSLGGRLVLVPGSDRDGQDVAATREQLLEVGFPSVEIAAAPARVAA